MQVCLGGKVEEVCKTSRGLNNPDHFFISSAGYQVDNFFVACLIAIDCHRCNCVDIVAMDLRPRNLVIEAICAVAAQNPASLIL